MKYLEEEELKSCAGVDIYWLGFVGGYSYSSL